MIKAASGLAWRVIVISSGTKAIQARSGRLKLGKDRTRSSVVIAAPMHSKRDGASTRTREVILDNQLELLPSTAATALAIAAQCNKMSDTLQLSLKE